MIIAEWQDLRVHEWKINTAPLYLVTRSDDTPDRGYYDLETAARRGGFPLVLLQQTEAPSFI